MKLAKFGHFPPGVKPSPEIHWIGNVPKHDAHVVFIEASHAYAIRDAEGMYMPADILTASGMFDFFHKDKCVLKPKPYVEGSEYVAKKSFGYWVERGTQFHSRMESLLLHGGIDTENDPDVHWAVHMHGLFTQTLEKFGLRLKGVETRLASAQHRVCGSVDIVLEDAQGVLHNHDWKRSKALFTDKVRGSRSLFDEGPGAEYEVDYDTVPACDGLVKYMFSEATYGALEAVHGWRVSPFTYLWVYNYEEGWIRTLKMNLDAPLRSRGGQSVNGMVRKAFEARANYTI